MLNDPVNIVILVWGVTLVTWPFLQPAVVKVMKLARSGFANLERDSATDDLSFVLGLAERLRKEGREKPARAAKALLDAMLEPEATK